MEANIEKNPATLVIAGNVGNTGNSAPASSSNKALDVVDLYPNGVSDTGSQWEQTELSNIVPTPDDLPPIPDRYKVLDIDGKTTPMSGMPQMQNRSDSPQKTSNHFLTKIERGNTRTRYLVARQDSKQNLLRNSQQMVATNRPAKKTPNKNILRHLNCLRILSLP